MLASSVRWAPPRGQLLILGIVTLLVLRAAAAVTGVVAPELGNGTPHAVGTVDDGPGSALGKRIGQPNGAPEGRGCLLRILPFMQKLQGLGEQQLNLRHSSRMLELPEHLARRLLAQTQLDRQLDHWPIGAGLAFERQCLRSRVLQMRLDGTRLLQRDGGGRNEYILANADIEAQAPRNRASPRYDGRGILGGLLAAAGALQAGQLAGARRLLDELAVGGRVHLRPAANSLARPSLC